MRFWEKLEAEYPKLCHTYPDAGCYCPKGWERLVSDLCAEIEELLVDETELSIGQIKEKFGGLRFYRNPYVPVGEDKLEQINEIISRYEKESCKTCVVCGRKAVAKNGRFAPACADHKL